METHRVARVSSPQAVWVMSLNGFVLCPRRCAEFKAGFCILGIQALAELNQWPGVLSWVLQQYEHLEEIPAKIMQIW